MSGSLDLFAPFRAAAAGSGSGAAGGGSAAGGDGGGGGGATGWYGGGGGEEGTRLREPSDAAGSGGDGGDEDLEGAPDGIGMLRERQLMMDAFSSMSLQEKCAFQLGIEPKCVRVRCAWRCP